MYTSEPYIVFQISQPTNIAQKWFCIRNLQMDLSFQEKKKQFANLLHSLQVTSILVIQENLGGFF